MSRNTTLNLIFCTGVLLLLASYSKAAEHGLDEKILSQIPENLQAIVDRGQSTGMVALVGFQVKEDAYRLPTTKQ